MSSETINKAKQAIDFAKIPDGTQEILSSAEKLEAAVKFRELVDDTLLRNVNDVVSYKPGALLANDNGSSRVSLGVTQEDGSMVSIGARTAASGVEINSGSKIEITIQELSPDGYGHKLHRYHMHTDDGEVRRFDRPDMYKTVSESPYNRIDFNRHPDAIVSGLKRLISGLKNEIENQELAQQMGLNDQPVGPDEIAKLRTLIEAAAVMKR